VKLPGFLLGDCARFRSEQMKPHNRTDRATAIRLYCGYRYTIVTIINGAQPRTEKAELWWQRETEQSVGRWTYFRRHVATTGAEAARRVESDFKEWVEGQMEADGQ
jgi:hypothetical protein